MKKNSNGILLVGLAGLGALGAFMYSRRSGGFNFGVVPPTDTTSSAATDTTTSSAATTPAFSVSTSVQQRYPALFGDWTKYLGGGTVISASGASVTPTMSTDRAVTLGNSQDVIVTTPFGVGYR